MLQVNISLPSGRSEKLSLEESSKVGDLRTLAQKAFRQGFLRLVTSDGRLLFDPQESLQAVGIQEEDNLAAFALQAKVAGTKRLSDNLGGAFALWCQGGNRILTCGHPQSGGDSSAVQHQLRNVQWVQATACAFVAILSDGPVISWGDPQRGGDSSAVQDQLECL